MNDIYQARRTDGRPDPTHPLSLVSLQRSIHELQGHVFILSQPGQHKLQEPPEGERQTGSGVKSAQFLYLIKSINSATEIYSVRAQPHQNPLAPDFRIPAMLFNENAADFRSQRIKSGEAGNPQHSH